MLQKTYFAEKQRWAKVK